MREETKIWLDYCQKGQKAIDDVISLILKEHGYSKDISKLDVDTRCQTRFEVYTNPIYTEYQTSLSTLVQVLRITGVNLNEQISFTV